eukprot:SAG22_NODE_2369_length_2651_cov_8.167712_4_plen_73_part_00
MPTLAALAGVPLPAGETLDGLSLEPLLADPTLTMLPARDWALSQVRHAEKKKTFSTFRSNLARSRPFRCYMY